MRYLNLIVFIVYLAISPLHAINCKQFGAFTQYNGHYYTTTKDRLTFEYAKTFAELGNGYLAIPDTAAENDFIASLILGNQFAWIGVYDPSLSNNYCYETGSCSYDDSRFKTVQNQSLSYRNWDVEQPDNLLKTSDVGQFVEITPLGEHWVALNSVSNKWYDFGNHNDEYNNPVKFSAVYEFDSKPECFKDDNSSELVDLHCNTAVSSINGLTSDSGVLQKCSVDEKGTPYCPATLAQCQNTQSTNDGYSVQHYGVTTTRSDVVCPNGTNLPSQCTGSYSNAWLKDMYTTLLNRCPDQTGYNHWLNYVNTLGITSSSQLQPTFCASASLNHEPCGSATPSPTTCYGSSIQNVTVQTPVTTTSNMTCPSGGTLNADKITCDKTCDNPTYYCPSGGTLSGSTCLKTCSSGYYYCPSGGTLSGSTCLTTTSYPATNGITIVGCSKDPIASYKGSSCGTTPDGKWNQYQWYNMGYSCPSGGTLSGSTCIVSSSYSASYTTSTYSCNYGASISSHNYYACPYNASCPNGTNLPSQCTGSYSNAWLKDMYTTLLNRCPDQTGYNHWLNYVNTLGITSSSQLQPTFCASASLNHEPCGSATPSPTTCYGSSIQNVTVQTPVTTTSNMTCPSGTNLPSQCTGSYSNAWLKDMYTTLLNRCPDQTGYNHWLNYANTLGITSSSQLQPTFCASASLNHEPCGSATPSDSTCYGSEPYDYYTYHCDSSPNIYHEDFVPQDAGGINSTSATPPSNNCVQQNYICNSNPDQTCAKVDGVWKCSEHPCVDANDMEHTDTEVGSQDGDDDGWNKNTGACTGQLYLFGGTSKACRSWDLYGVLDGSECCSDNALLFGLIKCSSEEKILAEKRKAGNCHYIGEFCSRKIKLGFAKICVQKKKSSCCFNSKLARIINEEGRLQLNKSWGTASNPECKGFTPEEFQKLDMSRIDFSEFIESFQMPDTQNIGDSIRNRVTNSLSVSFPQQ